MGGLARCCRRRWPVPGSANQRMISRANAYDLTALDINGLLDADLIAHRISPTHWYRDVYKSLWTTLLLVEAIHFTGHLDRLSYALDAVVIIAWRIVGDVLED